jgi:hypothetical protein
VTDGCTISEVIAELERTRKVVRLTCCNDRATESFPVELHLCLEAETVAGVDGTEIVMGPRWVAVLALVKRIFPGSRVQEIHST